MAVGGWVGVCEWGGCGWVGVGARDQCKLSSGTRASPIECTCITWSICTHMTVIRVQ